MPGEDGGWRFGTGQEDGRGLAGGEAPGPSPDLDLRVQPCFCQITNTSALESREVVQVYYDPMREGQPVRLAGWQAVRVGSGETVSVDVACDERMWRTWDEAASSWRVLTGGALLVARGLGDVRQRIGLS